MLSDLGARNEREDRQARMSHAYVPGHGALVRERPPVRERPAVESNEKEAKITDSMKAQMQADTDIKKLHKKYTNFSKPWVLGQVCAIYNSKSDMFSLGKDNYVVFNNDYKPKYGLIFVIFAGTKGIENGYMKIGDLKSGHWMDSSMNGLNSASESLEWTYADQAKNLGAETQATPGIMDTKFSIHTLAGSILAGAAVGLVIGNILGKRAKK